MPPETRDGALTGNNCSTLAEPVKHFGEPSTTGRMPAWLMVSPLEASGVGDAVGICANAPAMTSGESSARAKILVDSFPRRLASTEEAKALSEPAGRSDEWFLLLLAFLEDILHNR